jgi:hypothetical protein
VPAVKGAFDDGTLAMKGEMQAIQSTSLRKTIFHGMEEVESNYANHASPTN